LNTNESRGRFELTFVASIVLGIAAYQSATVAMNRAFYLGGLVGAGLLRISH